MIYRVYKKAGDSHPLLLKLLEQLRKVGEEKPQADAVTVWLFETKEELTHSEQDKLAQICGKDFEPDLYFYNVEIDAPRSAIIGPLQNFPTPFSTNAVRIAQNCGLKQVKSCEEFTILASFASEEAWNGVIPHLYDQLTHGVFSELPSKLRKTELPAKLSWTIKYDITNRKAGFDAITKFDQEQEIGWDEEDRWWITDGFLEEGRCPTDFELFWIAQVVTAGHSRHTEFRARYILDGVEQKKSPLELVQKNLEECPSNSRMAFKGNSSAIDGFPTDILRPVDPTTVSEYTITRRKISACFTAETHNHPSQVLPGEGAATGIGGMNRDQDAMRKGSRGASNLCGIVTANLSLPNYQMSWEDGPDDWSSPKGFPPARTVFIDSFMGAFRYGRCFGNPLLGGYTRTFFQNVDGQFFGYTKPIVYVSGTALVDDAHIDFMELQPDDIILAGGVEALRIGLGGSLQSSKVASEASKNLAFGSVQRGEPKSGGCAHQFITYCIYLGDDNPFEAVTDCGAAGVGNAGGETMSEIGGYFALRMLNIGDITMISREIGLSEFQENFIYVCRGRAKTEIAKAIGERCAYPLVEVGKVTGDRRIRFTDDLAAPPLVCDLPADKVLRNLPTKTIRDNTVNRNIPPLVLPDLTLREALEFPLIHPTTTSKYSLLKTADTSVGGLRVQAMYRGRQQLPISDYALHKNGFFDNIGTVEAIGEQPITSIVDTKKMVRLSIAEAITNAAGVVVPDASYYKFSGNWMLAVNEPGEAVKFYDAVEELPEFCRRFAMGLAEDGGKDSVKMVSIMIGPNGQEHRILAPTTLVIGLYGPVLDVNMRATADAKYPGSTLIHVDLGQGERRLGTSILAQCHRQISTDIPDISAEICYSGWAAVQSLVRSGKVRAIHDTNEAGVLHSALEMIFPNDLGLILWGNGNCPSYQHYLAGELGWLIECDPNDALEVIDAFAEFDLATPVGMITDENIVSVDYNGRNELRESMTNLRLAYMETSRRFGYEFKDRNLTDIEHDRFGEQVKRDYWHISFTPPQIGAGLFEERTNLGKVLNFSIEGTNSMWEMAAFFKKVGLRVYDGNLNDIAAGRLDINDYNLIAGPGGFDHMDVYRSALGARNQIVLDDRIREMFDTFRRRNDTFAYAECNKMQLLTLLGWVPLYGDEARPFTGGELLQPHEYPNMRQNASRMFEGRMIKVKILDSPCVFTKDMAGSVFGLEVAHGEGRFVASDGLYDQILAAGLAPIRYVDWDGEITEEYPFNPNGSRAGVAGVCSPCGHFFALMPHPSRYLCAENCTYTPLELQELYATGVPTLKFAENGRAALESIL